MTKYTPARKGGRCFNGAHRDAGIIVHAVPGVEGNGFWGDKAACGVSPGRRGYGWTTENTRPVNCEKCLKKIKS